MIDLRALDAEAFKKHRDGGTPRSPLIERLLARQVSGRILAALDPLQVPSAVLARLATAAGESVEAFYHHCAAANAARSVYASDEEAVHLARAAALRTVLKRQRPAHPSMAEVEALWSRTVEAKNPASSEDRPT